MTEFNSINLLFLPVFIPIIIAGKVFLDHQDFKMAFEALFSKKTIIFTFLGLAVAVLLQGIL